MSKRSAKEQIDSYRKKIRKLESKEIKRRRRVIVYSDSSSDLEENSDIQTTLNKQYRTSTLDDNINVIEQENDNIPPLSNIDKAVETQCTEDPESTHSAQVLDPEVLQALGEPITEDLVYGEKIHPDLSQRWAPLLRKGLTDKSFKDTIIKEYATPENCKLLRAPLLNPEIAAAVSEFARARDKKIEANQNQLGVGLTAINRAMTLLLSGDQKVQAIKKLSDACRILCDLHAAETQTRMKSLVQGLDKSFLNVIHESERDEMLFGSNLPEKIKASKAIEKQGSQIKKTETKTTSGPSSSRPSRPPGNWKGPSRQTNRGGRGGSNFRRTPNTNRNRMTTTQYNFTPMKNWNRPPRAGPQT